MAGSQQIPAIQTQQETIPVNKNSRTPFKRKTKKSSPKSPNSFPSPPPPDSAGGAPIHRSPEYHVRKEYRCAESIRNCKPGFRFVPKDEELIGYLVRKLGKEEINIEIHDVNLYKYNPEDLAEKYEHLGELEWYFFTPRDRKYPNGFRPNRSAGNGYWKATGADKKITLDTNTPNERIIGYRKALVFYQGNPPSGEKTNWIMHEFRLEAPPRIRENPEDMRLDDYVLCKIYEKPEKKVSSNQTSDQEESHEDPGMHTPTSTLEICNDEQCYQAAVDMKPPPNGEGISYSYYDENTSSIMHFAMEEPSESLTTWMSTPSLSKATQLEPFHTFGDYYNQQEYTYMRPNTKMPFYPAAPAGDSLPQGERIKREGTQF